MVIIYLKNKNKCKGVFVACEVLGELILLYAS